MSWLPRKGVSTMDVQAVVALVVGTLLVLSLPALLLSGDLLDQIRNALKR
jgi:hypothetical protein